MNLNQPSFNLKDAMQQFSANKYSQLMQGVYVLLKRSFIVMKR